MKIMHVSYARVKNYTDPERWLTQINFFTGILEEMAKTSTVESIHLISYSGTLLKNNVLYHFIKVNIWNWIFPLRLNTYIQNCKPDVIIVHGLIFPWQLLWLRLQLYKKVKIAVQHHAEIPLRFPKSILQKIVDHQVRHYFFASVDLAKPWVVSHQIKDLSKVCEVMPVSSPFYPSLKKEGSGPESKTYLWVGRLDENKDPFTLVYAFLKFLEAEPRAVLHIVFRGGHLLSDIKNLLSTTAFSRQIILEGAVDHKKMLYRYHNAAFIISTSRSESGGAAVCEGMSCGCIPLLSNIPSFRTMTKNGEVGLLFEVGNVEDLAQSLFQSRFINITNARQKVLDQFRTNLSFEAISNKMMEVITNK